MGVRTKAWGPHTWKFLHGFCLVVDQYLEEHPDDTKTRNLVVDCLNSLKYVVPCVYCRQSLTKFVRRGATRLPNLRKGGSFAFWAYKIHECVNRKLFWQQVKMNPDKIWIFEDYQPDFDQVEYTTPDSGKWWFSFFTFCYYVMCDFPKPAEKRRFKEISLFLPRVAKILRSVGHPNGRHFCTLLNKSGLTPRSRLTDRIKFIHTVHSNMKLKNGTSIPSPTDIEKVCSYAIVGCDPSDTNRVGC